MSASELADKFQFKNVPPLRMTKPEAAAAAPRCRPSSRLLASAALAAASVALLLSVVALLAATSGTRGRGELEAEHDLLVTSRPDLCLDTPDPGPCTSTVPRRDHTNSQSWSAISRSKTGRDRVLLCVFRSIFLKLKIFSSSPLKYELCRWYYTARTGDCIQFPWGGCR